MVAPVVHRKIHRALEELHFLLNIHSRRFSQNQVQQSQRALEHDGTVGSSANVVGLDRCRRNQAVDDKVASANRVGQRRLAIVGVQIVHDDGDVGGRDSAGFP